MLSITEIEFEITLATYIIVVGRVEEQLFWKATDGNILNQSIIGSLNYRNCTRITIGYVDIVVGWVEV